MPPRQLALDIHPSIHLFIHSLHRVSRQSHAKNPLSLQSLVSKIQMLSEQRGPNKILQAINVILNLLVATFKGVKNDR